MSVYRVGSKVHVPKLGWTRAEIIQVKPFWSGRIEDGSPHIYLGPDDDQGAMYRVKNPDSDETHWCISEDLILVA